MKTFFFILMTVLICVDKDGMDATNKVEEASLIAIISNPEKYHNKLVSVVGYLKFENEGNAIYVNKDDCNYNIFKNALALKISDKEIIERRINYTDEGYATVIGLFNKNHLGKYNLFSGGLESIQNIYWQEKNNVD